MQVYAGLDAGSVSVKLVVIDAAGHILDHSYVRHKGRPLEIALPLLERAIKRHGPLPLAVTGTSGRQLADILAAPHYNELVALALAMRAAHPEVRTVMEMGGEDAKFLILEHGAIKDFALNSVCAAGTGSFLDQQAERMRMGIEAFADLALESKAPPPIAGRCSVFAKSDMIHLQQIATPVADIVAGLCFAVARNFQGSIVRNRPMPEGVAFLGGVAMNQGVVRAFRDVFGLENLLTPDIPTIYSAMGAAMRLQEDVIREQALQPPLDGNRLEQAWLTLARSRHGGITTSAHGVLVAPGDDFATRHDLSQCAAQNAPEGKTLPDAAAGGFDAYLGVDIGSISTCLAVVDASGDLIAKRYLRTASRPIEAVRQGLREIQEELGAGCNIRGVGTTGSGRYMIADCIGADLVKNEITAQARGAVCLDALEHPDHGGGVDTIFEIGGQDSKYIRLQDGVILDFEMNKACAAGTGSFLEEQAEKLGVSVKGEFAGLALDADAPCALGERCTVFMENSLMSALQQGAGKDDLLAGLSYSIVENYINRVVAGRPIGDKIFFQGGTACNKAVVAAFEKYLGEKIRVPRHTDVSGAIGMALLAREHVLENGVSRSAFKGFAQAQRPYEQSSFACKGCDNHCEINRVRFEGDADHLYYGGRCEKYDIKRRKRRPLPDLFALRRAELERRHREYEKEFLAARESGRTSGTGRLGRIGLPRVFFLQDWLTYCSTLLWELGFEVVVSSPTDHKITSLGTQTTLAETCFPVKAALGHVRRLLQDGVERIFLPSFVDMSLPGNGEAGASSLACPLTQSFPYQARVLIRDASEKGEIAAPVINWQEGRLGVFASLFTALKSYGVGPLAMWRAMTKAEAAQEAFGQTMRAAGADLLARLGKTENGATLPDRALVVIGRSYNALDQGMNLDIPRKLASLDTVAIPMDALPLDDMLAPVLADWPEMYWRSGQRMLAAARSVRLDPRLDALVIGSFSCGPDSFIMEYFTKEMQGRPFLHIEIDEHSADAGVITRCEAFLDSLEMRRRLEEKGHAANLEKAAASPLRHGKKRGRVRKVYVPRMGDQAFGLAAAFTASGLDAEVMRPTDNQAMDLARRYISGKECYPFAVTTADMLRTAMSADFAPETSAFFMPSGSGPCRFGQYNLLQRMILERAGFPETPILSPMQDSSFYEEVGEIGNSFARISWKGILVFDLLNKCLQGARPYESVLGQADALYAQALQEIPGYLAGDEAILGRVLGTYAERFAGIRKQGLASNGGARPLVGIVGEIFVRTNAFSNEDLVRKVEALGGEAWLASVDEWIYYVNWGAARNALKRRKALQLGQVLLKDVVQRRIAHRLEVSTGEMQREAPSIHDPGTRAILKKAAPYLHHSFRGEAVLSVGKAVDMLERGAKGIVVAMPFGCMPGTVATSLLRSVCARFGAPMISIPYDGTASSATRLQLEAFMEQVVRRG